MATDINAGMIEEQTVLTVSRQIAGPPWRSAQRTWRDLSSFWLDVLKQRAFPRSDETATALQDLTPLGQQWVIQHALETTGLVFDTGDLHLEVRVTYQAELDEDLSPLPLELLDDLPADALLTLYVPNISRAQEPAVAAAIAAAAEHGLALRVDSDAAPDTVKENADGHDAQ